MSSVSQWYVTLQKPDWTPPSWVFGPVWTVLYLMIAISGWLIWMRKNPLQKKRVALVLYGAQLLCNLLWSYFFFSLQNPGLALLNICALLILIGLNIASFKKLYRPAAILLIPYFLWTLYAAALNAAIWSLNH